MKIILLGAPACGKGTHSKLISAKYNIPQISTGEILRQNIKDKTSIGLLAEEIIKSGGLVSDEIVIELVKNRLKEKDTQSGYILDGFPRTVKQAEELKKFAKIDCVINISVPFSEIIKRITQRRICSKCGQMKDVLNNETSYCDGCGGVLVQRQDDTEEVVKARLEVYEKQTSPLIDFYTKENLLKNIDGNGKIEDVNKKICDALIQ